MCVPLYDSVAHLALEWGFLVFNIGEAGTLPFQFTPDDLHPTAAASFADMLQHTLRSVLLPIRFRSCYRGLGEWPSCEGYQYHFAQTLPLVRREHPAGAFHWFDEDSRPGVDIDIRQLPLGQDPRILVCGWKQLEQTFGVARAAEQQPGARDTAGDPGLRLYICPRVAWPKYEREDVVRMNRSAAQLGLPRTGMDEDEGEEEEPGPRAQLARHLRNEAADWQHSRTWLHESFNLRIFHDAVIMPRQGYVLDAETFENMERLPCTAIGLWLFPAEAFKEPTVPQRFCYDLSPVRPGLFLFEV